MCRCLTFALALLVFFSCQKEDDDPIYTHSEAPSNVDPACTNQSEYGGTYEVQTGHLGWKVLDVYDDHLQNTYTIYNGFGEVKLAKHDREGVQIWDLSLQSEVGTEAHCAITADDKLVVAIIYGTTPDHKLAIHQIAPCGAVDANLDAVPGMNPESVKVQRPSGPSPSISDGIYVAGGYPQGWTLKKLNFVGSELWSFEHSGSQSLSVGGLDVNSIGAIGVSLNDSVGATLAKVSADGGQAETLYSSTTPLSQVLYAADQWFLGKGLGGATGEGVIRLNSAGDSIWFNTLTNGSSHELCDMILSNQQELFVISRNDNDEVTFRQFDFSGNLITLEVNNWQFTGQLVLTERGSDHLMVASSQLSGFELLLIAMTKQFTW